jgi:hypothetical protein
MNTENNILLMLWIRFSKKVRYVEIMRAVNMGLTQAAEKLNYRLLAY